MVLGTDSRDSGGRRTRDFGRDDGSQVVTVITGGDIGRSLFREKRIPNQKREKEKEKEKKEKARQVIEQAINPSS